MEIVTVRDIIENFLESTDIKIVKNEEYEKVMEWYEKIAAVPMFEYKQLVQAQKTLDARIMAGEEDVKENN